MNKLDLTVNFIDVDTFEESIHHLRSLLHLKELYLMGNPCQEWEGHRDFIVHLLPQLKSYDGKEVRCAPSTSGATRRVTVLNGCGLCQITRSERIVAGQKFGELRAELRRLANEKRVSKGLPTVAHCAAGDEDDDGTSEWSPEERTRMYREMAEEKEAQEASRSHMDPKKRCGFCRSP